MPPGQDLLRVALAQIDPTVGDIRGNARKIAEHTSAAREQGAALVVFPELTLSGYPPEDLLLKTSFLDDVGAALEELAAQTRGIVALVGFPERADDVYNSAAVLADGEVAAVYRKMYLPNYGVFDEQRYFQSGSEAGIFEPNGIPIGVSICEDIWEPGPPAMTEALAGAQVIVNLSASPDRGPATAMPASVCRCSGPTTRRGRVRQHRRRPGRAGVRRPQPRDRPGRPRARPLPAVRGVPDALHHRPSRGGLGAPARHAPPGERAPPAARVPDRRAARRAPGEPRARRRPSDGDRGGSVAELLDPDAELYAALRTGLRDYVDKNRFERVVLALSGGIDSALVAMVAADALGPERVTCVSMPSPFSSEGTRADARSIAENLGTEFIEISIQDAMGAYDAMLADVFAGRDPDVAEENVQARIRGNS